MKKTVNCWKCHTIGLLALVSSSVVIIGCGSDSDRSSNRRAPKDTLVVKGLYMGMPGGDAVEACKKLVGASKDLVVVDFRNGIEREKDEETKAKEKKDWEARVKLAETDIDLFQKWNSLNGEVYDPSVENCEGRIPDPHSGELFHDEPFRPRLKWMSGDKSAKVPGPQWTLASAMAAFAGIYGYQVEWMLPGKHKGENAEKPVPKLYSGKVSVPEKMKDSDLHSVWNSEVLKKGLLGELYSKGLRLSKENEKRVFFRLAFEDAQGNPVDKKKLATELVLNNPKFFEEFGSNQEKIEAAEKELEGFLLWVEFGEHGGMSLIDPDDPRPENVKERERRDAERMAEMEKRGDATKANRMSTSMATATEAEIKKLKAQLWQMENTKSSLDREIAELGKRWKFLLNTVKNRNEQAKKQPSLKNNPVFKESNAKDKARLTDMREKYDAAREKRNNVASAIADMKAKIASKEAEVRKEIAAQEKAIAEAKAAEEKAAADKKAKEELAFAKKNRTDLRFLTAARTGVYNRTTSNYAYQFSETMKKMAVNCNAMLEWAVLTEPADKLEEITEVFSIPAGDYESAVKFVGKLDGNLGKFSENNAASDGSRKKIYFEKDLVDIYSPLWFRLVLKTTNGVEVAKADAVKNWLEARGHRPPSDKMIIPKKNLIQISIKKDGVREDKLVGLCFVWIDDQGDVRQTYFNENGMDRFFNAEDISCEEFAHALVQNYSKIPSLDPHVKRDDLEKGSIQETTWIYKDPKGYQVKLFERVFLDVDGRKYDSKMIEKLSKNNPEVALGMAFLSLADKRPEKFLVFSAIKPQSERKFD